MGRPPSITEDEVLAAAKAVFLQKGIAGTVADVAKRCGVSEASVLRRFPTKNELFRAAMVHEPFAGGIELLRRPAAGRDVRATLLALGAGALEYYRKWLPIWMMVATNPTVAEQQYRRRLRLAMSDTLGKYFARQIRAGRIRGSSPDTAVLMFLGPIVTYALMQHTGAGVGELSEAQLLEDLVDALCVPGTRR